MKKLTESKVCMIVSCILALLIAIQHQYVYMYFDDYGYASLSYVSHTWDQLGVSYNFVDIMRFLAYHWLHWDGRQLYFFFEIVTFRLGGVELIQIVQAVVVILIGVFSGKLVAAETGKDSWKCIALSFAFYGLFDIATLNDGVYWYTASVLYVWPLLPLLAGIYLFAYGKEKCNKKIYMILCPVLFFMAAYSQEQMAVLTITCLWTMIVLELIKQRTIKFKAVPGVLLGSGISSLVGGVLCICAPGNFARAGGTRYEDFYSKSFWQRIWEGICSVADINIGPYNWIFVILFTIMCGLTIVIVMGRKSAAAVSLLFCAYFIFEHFTSIPGTIVSGVRILWVVVVGSYFIFYFLSQKNYVLLSLFIGGICSQGMLIVSPSISMRSHTMLEFIMHIIMVQCLADIRNVLRGNDRHRTIMVAVNLFAIIVLIYSAVNFSAVLSGYQVNAEINQINHAKMLEAKKNYQVNGEKPERIELYKLKDDRFANIMPYQPTREGIEYWMKNYYELTMDVPIFWQQVGEKRVIEVLEGEWYDDGFVGKSLKLRFDSNFENIITLRVNNTEHIEGQSLVCIMGEFETIYNVSGEDANEFYLTVPSGENEIYLVASETAILEEDGREVSVKLEVAY